MYSIKNIVAMKLWLTVGGPLDHGGRSVDTQDNKFRLPLIASQRPHISITILDIYIYLIYIYTYIYI